MAKRIHTISRCRMIPWWALLVWCIALGGLIGWQVAENLKAQKLLLQVQQENQHLRNRYDLLQKQHDVLAETVSTGWQNEWQSKQGEATMYSPFDDKDGNQSNGGKHPRTSLGMQPSRGIAAVDPKKIPYYSKVLVVYPDGHVRAVIAGDTGGALRKNKHVQVDLFAKTFTEATGHGRQQVTILWQAPKRD